VVLRGSQLGCRHGVKRSQALHDQQGLDLKGEYQHDSILS